MNTREKILYEALNQFSSKGFNAVSVRDIAKAVGIKESSLYNHFKNKQDIFDCIVSECSSRGDEFFHRVHLTGEDRQFAADQRAVDMYKNMTTEQFVALSGMIFEYYFADEINVKFRRMLTIEQYRNEAIARLYREISFDSSLDYQAKLFEVMMQAGYFIEADSYVMALEFFSPIFLIFYKFDNDKKSLEEAKDLFIKHIRHFSETYSKKSAK